MDSKTQGWMPRWAGAAAMAWLALASAPAGAASPGGQAVTDAQRVQAAEAAQGARAGVPLQALSPQAPSRYVVRPGDTLWALAGLFLRSPWRWPELWGVNQQGIRNPHRIYPGQVLFLDTSGGRARLSLQPPGGGLAEVKLSPRARNEPVESTALPVLPPHVIEPFLTESLIVDAQTLADAPRVVAPRDDRVLMQAGDRIYARATEGQDLALPDGQPRRFLIFREATPILRPGTDEVLGYEAQFVGDADLIRPPGEVVLAEDGDAAKPVPATLVVRLARQEVYVGDRLLPQPPNEFPGYMPHAPADEDFTATIVALHGDSVAMVGPRQVVVLDKGSADGVDSGLVLAVSQSGASVVDTTSPGRERIRLPDERNGTLMVFRVFEHLSYALILNIESPVAVGDHLMSPQ